MKRYLLVFMCLSLILTIISCNDTDSSELEVVNIQSDMELCKDLQELEDKSTIIVEAIPRENLRQNVNTDYNSTLGKDLPGYGYTVWDIEVKKVYKGDVKAGDKLEFLQEYYIWKKDDGNNQLVSISARKPIMKGNKYLMFLVYNESLKGYSAVSDYQGMFAKPDDELKLKVAKGTIDQSDLEVYSNETLSNLFPIYTAVVEKYFD